MMHPSPYGTASLVPCGSFAVIADPVNSSKLCPLTHETEEGASSVNEVAEVTSTDFGFSLYDKARTRRIFSQS